MENYYDFLKYNENKLIKEDIDKIKKLREELKNYDLFDFLANVSALILIPENQSKSVIFQCMISTALSIPEHEISFNNKMSMGKFKQIVNAFSNLNRKIMVDPPEFPFVLPVMYYNNFHVFMGANSISPTNVNNLLKVLSNYNDKIERKEYIKLNKIVTGLLNLSEHIYVELHLQFEKLNSYNKDIDIYIPSSNILSEYKKLLIYNKEIMNSLFNSSVDELECYFNSTKVNEIIDFENQLFYTKPFLNLRGKYVILDITTFISLIMHKILDYTFKFSKFDFVKKYNELSKFALEESFHRLENCKLDAEQFGIELLNDDDTSEVLYSSGNDGIIINIMLFDTGENYYFEKNHMNKKKRKHVFNRINYIVNKLNDNYIDMEKIVIIITPGTIGRNMLYSLEKCDMSNILILAQYELEAISINEAEDNLFFQRYIAARKKLNHYEKNLFSELNIIALYVNKDYSFYFNDDVDIKDVYINIIGEYSARYIKESYLKEDRHLVKYLTNNALIEIIKLDRNIYFAPGLFFEKIINKVLKINKFTIWIITEENINSNLYDSYNLIIDLIAFWFSEFSECFKNINYSYIINITIDDSMTNYITYDKIDVELNDIFEIEINKNILNIHFKENALYYFECENNLKEKEFICCLLKLLSSQNSDINIEKELMDEKFKNPYKKKILSINSIKEPYMLPFSSNKIMKVSRSDENIILDKVGLYLLNDLKVKYGIIRDNKILNHVVELLYKDLTDKLMLYDKESLLKYLYLQYEKIISSIHIRQKHYVNDISCYPEHEKEIDENFNELNKCSVALKFLIELTSSLKNMGSQKISEYDIEFCLAISSQIIEWAYAGDLFNYKMIDSPINLLRSNRIGFDHGLINKTGKSLYQARKEKMNVRGMNKIEELSKYNNIKKETDDNFEEAFLSEFGYSFKDFTEVAFSLLEYAESNSYNLDDIFEIDINFLINELNEKVSKETKIKIIDTLSLKEREDYLCPPKPYRIEDTYPWRNNRELSLNRKPLIIYGGKIIYGYRTLINSVYFLFDLIKSAKYKARSAEMKKYISKISNYNGDRFNVKVFNYISSFKTLIVDKNIKKINGKKISDDNKNDLGDIDVLYISNKKNLIVVGEVKNFELSKNLYEIYNEYIKMFDGSNPKSFYNKHMKRVAWVKNHIDDVIKYYGLPNKKWKIDYIFIVDNYLVSKDTFGLNVNISTLNNLDYILKKL